MHLLKIFISAIPFVFGIANASPLPHPAPAPRENNEPECVRLDEPIDFVDHLREFARWNAKLGPTMLEICKLITNSLTCETLDWIVDELLAMALQENKHAVPSNLAVGTHMKFLQNAFSEFSYAHMEDVTDKVHSRIANTDMKRPLAVTNIHGFSSKSGRHNNTLNVQHYLYGKGIGHLYVPFSANFNNTADGKNVFDATMNHVGFPGGFKLSTHSLSPNNLGLGSLLDMAHMTGLSWLWDSMDFDLGNWIGQLTNDYGLVDLAWRLIPELVGFGENYENVDICGPVD